MNNNLILHNGIIRWNHTKIREQLTPHFHSDEFICRCGNCTETLISIELLGCLEQVRNLIGEPIKISSGFRCASYQSQLYNTGQTDTVMSQHTLGKAADLVVMQDSLPKLILLAKQAFSALGVGSNFIHVDTRRDKRRYWSYEY